MLSVTSAQRQAGVRPLPGSVKIIARMLVRRSDAEKMGFLREDSFSSLLQYFSHAGFLLSCSSFHKVSSGLGHLGRAGCSGTVQYDPVPKLSEHGCTFPVVRTVSF